MPNESVTSARLVQGMKDSSLPKSGTPQNGRDGLLSACFGLRPPQLREVFRNLPQWILLRRNP